MQIPPFVASKAESVGKGASNEVVVVIMEEQLNRPKAHKWDKPSACIQRAIGDIDCPALGGPTTKP